MFTIGRQWIASRTVILAAVGLMALALSTAAAVPLFDPDEGYYPATAAESVDSGAWWDLHFNGEPRWDKPVLAYALIEGSFALFGRGPVAARLPSALEGAALVLLTGVLVSGLAGPRAGNCSAIVLATSLGAQLFTRAAHPEIALVLSMAVTELLLTVWLVLPSGQRPRRLAVWIGISLGYGLLAKGPVAVVVPGLGFAVAAPFVTDMRGRLREVVSDGGMAGLVAVAVSAPWYAAMTWRHGLGFLRDGVWAQNFGRYTGEIEHGQSALVFVVACAIGLMPWTALLPAAVGRLRHFRGDRPGAVGMVMAITAATSLAFYTLSASKLASYSLALVPPLSVLIGLFLAEWLDKPDTHAAPFRATSVTLGLLAVVLLAVPLFQGILFSTRDLVGGVPAAQPGLGLWSLVVPVALVLVAGAAMLWWLPARARLATLAAIGCATPLVALLASGPLINDAYPWQRFGKHMTGEPGPVWIQNYRAPSLTFYAARPVERVVGDEALAALIKDADHGWVVLGADWAAKAPLAGRIRAGRAAVVDRTPRLALVWLR